MGAGGGRRGPRGEARKTGEQGCRRQQGYQGQGCGASLDEPLPGDQFYISGCCYFHFTDSLPKLMSGKHTKHKEFANFGLGVAVVYPTSVNYYQFGMEFGSFEKRWSCPRERPNVFAEAPVTFLFC